MKQHLHALGVSAGTVAPPLWRLLWRMGVDVPPPLFLRFLPAAALLGGFFGLGWGLLMWPMYWARHGLPLGAALAAMVFAGTSFGLLMAAYLRFMARRHRLPAWADYTGAPNA